jgi:hypothetical protein
MMNHEHVFTVNNPEVHKAEFFMTFVMMASELKDNKFVINPKGKHYLVIASLNITYSPNVGLRLFTGDLNAKNQVYPFFDKENKVLNPHRDSKIPYLPSYHVEMRTKGNALFVEDGNFNPLEQQTFFNYVNVHNIDLAAPDNGFKEIVIQTSKDTPDSYGKLTSIRQCGDGRWIAWKAKVSSFAPSWLLFQNWTHITTANPIQFQEGTIWRPRLPIVCGPNTCIEFYAHG